MVSRFVNARRLPLCFASESLDLALVQYPRAAQTFPPHLLRLLPERDLGFGVSQHLEALQQDLHGLSKGAEPPLGVHDSTQRGYSHIDLTAGPAQPEPGRRAEPDHLVRTRRPMAVRGGRGSRTDELCERAGAIVELEDPARLRLVDRDDDACEGHAPERVVEIEVDGLA